MNSSTKIYWYFLVIAFTNIIACNTVTTPQKNVKCLLDLPNGKRLEIHFENVDLEPTTATEVHTVDMDNDESIPDRKLLPNSNPSEIQAETNIGNLYEIMSLNRHNYFRRMHNAPDLRLNQTLIRKAQSYAKKLVRFGTFENEQEKDINKNVYYVSGKGKSNEDSVVAAVDAWYSEIENYDWNDPWYSTFSQVVWKSTTDLGIGIASGNGRTVVVSVYYPAGNIAGKNGIYFRKNVQPKS